MQTDDAPHEALKNILDQIKLLISTTAPMPDNRTPRCLELLGAASALAKDRRRGGAKGSTQPEMDAAAKQARPMLEQNWQRWSVPDLADWWHQWHLKAGHKRLGRMLLRVTGKTDGVFEYE